MSDPAPSAPTSFQKFTEFARQIIAVPKAEADKKDREWREKQAEKKRVKR